MSKGPTKRRTGKQRPKPAPITEKFELDANTALMLDLLGQRPVTFHRSYVGVAGGIAGAVWLSYAMARHAEAVAWLEQAHQPVIEPVWFSLRCDSCEEATGMTWPEQDAVRLDLHRRGLVLEQPAAATHQLAIDTRRLSQLLMAQTCAHWGLDYPVAAPGVNSRLEQSRAAVRSAAVVQQPPGRPAGLPTP